MTYGITNAFDFGGVGLTLTLPASCPDAGLRLSVPDTCIGAGLRFVVKCVGTVSSYRYIAAEGTGLYLTVSAPESLVCAGKRVKRLVFRTDLRRYAAPRIGRMFALRL